LEKGTCRRAGNQVRKQRPALHIGFTPYQRRQKRRHSVTDAQTGIKPIFDADKVQKAINAQMQIAQALAGKLPGYRYIP
jgi:hypothetical protein